MGSHFLLQGIFSTQVLNAHLLNYRQILYQLSYQGSPKISEGSVIIWKMLNNKERQIKISMRTKHWWHLPVKMSWKLQNILLWTERQILKSSWKMLKNVYSWVKTGICYFQRPVRVMFEPTSIGRVLLLAVITVRTRKAQGRTFHLEHELDMMQQLNNNQKVYGQWGRQRGLRGRRRTGRTLLRRRAWHGCLGIKQARGSQDKPRKTGCSQTSQFLMIQLKVLKTMICQ